MKRVLLVAYHFGPGSATGGLRWNAMTDALGERGWAFDVITVQRQPSERPPTPTLHNVVVHEVARPRAADRAVEKAVWLKRRLVRRTPSAGTTPPGNETVRTWGKTDRRSRYTRLMFNLNAARERLGDFGWATAALSRARSLAATNSYAAVVVSSPPHVAQRIGVAISRDCGVPFVADFRDPWTFGVPFGYLSSAVDRLVAPLVEPEVFDEASVIVCNTEWSRRAAAKMASGRRARTVSIPNGYDPLDSVATPDLTRFRVVFCGWLYPHMDPRPLLAACGRLRSRSRDAARALSVEFLGTAPAFGSVPLESLAAAHGLEGCFALAPSTNREAALAFQQAAAVTTAFDYPHPLAVPMKFYDQAQMRGSMLLIGNPSGALADAAGQIGLRVYARSDAEGIDEALTRAFERWQAGDYPAPLDAGRLFDRSHATERMDAVLRSLAADTSG